MHGMTAGRRALTSTMMVSSLLKFRLLSNECSWRGWLSREDRSTECCEHRWRIICLLVSVFMFYAAFTYSKHPEPEACLMAAICAVAGVVWLSWGDEIK